MMNEIPYRNGENLYTIHTRINTLPRTHLYLCIDVSIYIFVYIICSHKRRWKMRTPHEGIGKFIVICDAELVENAFAAHDSRR